MEHLVIMSCPLMSPKGCVAAPIMLGKLGTSPVNHVQLQEQVKTAVSLVGNFSGIVYQILY